LLYSQEINIVQDIKKTSVLWAGLDVLLFLALWFAVLFVCGAIAGSATSRTQPQEQAADKGDQGHPVAQLVGQSKHSPIVLLVAFLAAVVAAPLVEELLFRLFLQGWLEAKFMQFHVPCASGVAIVAVSFFFAAIHGGNSVALDPQVLFYTFVVMAMANLLIFALGIFYLVRIRNVRMTHYLFGTGQFVPSRFFTCTGYCFLALLFIYGLSVVLNMVYPTTNTNPIPIFFLSLLLGTLYSKTQNLSYCILLHACVNGTSLVLVWLSIQ